MTELRVTSTNKQGGRREGQIKRRGEPSTYLEVLVAGEVRQRGDVVVADVQLDQAGASLDPRYRCQLKLVVGGGRDGVDSMRPEQRRTRASASTRIGTSQGHATRQALARRG